ncbi:visual pigment-like receptor peropsin [Lineus longissimus]|uniref:visual pigment-like receptor peropsin n=1 Tax=Lineus longissimus TaxID=88925 RepID=UPI00315DAAD5
MECNQTTGQFDTRVLDALGGYMAIASVLGMIGNALVVAAWITHRKLRAPSNAFLINLAISDFSMLCTSGMLTSVALLMHCWPFSYVVCQFCGFFAYTTGLASLATHFFIAASRCELIVHKSKVLAICSPVKVIPAIWVFALFWSTCPLIGWSGYARNQLTCEIEWDKPTPAYLAYIVCIFILVFVGPFMGMIICYILIVLEVVKSKRTVHGTLRQSKIIKPGDIRLVKMMLMMAIAFMTCWVPYAVVSFMKAFNLRDDSHMYYLANVLPPVFAKSSALANFIIYIMTNKNFRAALYNMFRGQCAESRPGLDFSSSTIPAGTPLSLSIEIQRRRIDLNQDGQDPTAGAAM